MDEVESVSAAQNETMDVEAQDAHDKKPVNKGKETVLNVDEKHKEITPDIDKGPTLPGQLTEEEMAEMFNLCVDSINAQIKHKERASLIEKSGDGKLRSDLTIEEICELVRDCVNWITKQADYDKPEVNKCVQIILESFMTYGPARTQIVRILCTDGFPECVVKMIESSPHDYGHIYQVAQVSSGCSFEFSKQLGEAGLIKILLTHMKDLLQKEKQLEERFQKLLFPNLEEQQKGKNLMIAGSSSVILYNMSKVPEVKNIYREENAIEILKPHLSSKNPFLHMIGALTLANIINEEENELLDQAGCFVFLSHFLKKALDVEDDHQYLDLTSVQLTEGLAHLAVNDKNKIKIIEAKVLPSLVIMMKGDIVEEQTVAAKCCWTLSFDKQARQKLKDEEGCIPALEALAESDQKEVQKMAAGALWKIHGKGEKKSKKIKDGDTKENHEKKHVFISYNHKHKEIVHKIADRLLAEDYNLWIDRDNICGSAMEAMASAVENASVIIICMSEYYKLSPPCKAEAEYAFNRRVPVIPLMMQREYKPDGWLGLLLGAKIYIPFLGITTFDVSYQKLKRELSYKVKPKDDTVDGPIRPQTVHHQSLLPSSHVTHDAASWDKEDVKQWLYKHGLDRYKDHFRDYEGEIMLALKEMRDKAPEFFYSEMKREVFPKLNDLLRFTRALSDLG